MISGLTLASGGCNVGVDRLSRWCVICVKATLVRETLACHFPSFVVVVNFSLGHVHLLHLLLFLDHFALSRRDPSSLASAQVISIVEARQILLFYVIRLLIVRTTLVDVIL